MPSHTRSNSSISKSSLTPFQKKQKMSLTQTYYLAHTARGKLSKEAARADHDLRLLVGHANLLDGLMIDLADAEKEQESWFNNTVRAASTTVVEQSEPKHIQWSDNLPAVSEDYYEDSESSSDEESDDEVSYSTSAPLRRIRSPPAVIVSEEAIEDDDEDDEELQLVRTPSRSSPPELLHEHDSESDSDDDSTPPSPPQADIPLDAFSARQKEIAAQGADKSSISITTESFYEEGFYLPQRQEVPAF